MVVCPNKSHPDWTPLVERYGENLAYYYWHITEGNVGEYLQSDKSFEIKPGVEELFESNPELANTIYEALGLINTSEIQLDKPRVNPDNAEAISYPIKINGKYAGVISVDKDGYISSSIGMAGVELEKEFQGQGYGTKIYIALAEKLDKEGKTLKSEAFGKADINEAANRVWKSLLDKGYAVDKGTYFEIQLKDKQQAQQLYSQYLDTIFPDSQVKDIVYHGTNLNFEKFDKNRIGGNTAVKGERPSFSFSNNKQQAEAYSSEITVGQNTNELAEIWFNNNQQIFKNNDINTGIIDINNVVKHYENELKNSEEMISPTREIDTKTDKYKLVPVNNDTIRQLAEIKTREWQEEYNTLLTAGARVMSVILDIKNPKIVDFKGEKKSVKFKEEQLTTKGDAFIAKNIDDWGKGDVIQVFEPKQIHILGSKQDIEGFKEFVNNKQQVNNSKIQKVISPKDKIIWAHPTIGKTTARKTKNFLDFDTDFKPLVAQKLGLPKNKQNSLGLNEWRKTGSKEVFNKVMLEVWEIAKTQAVKEGKQLMTSDMLFLKENAEDFDKVINISANTFIDRASQRGDNVEELNTWKQNIDNVLSNIDSNKIVTTNQYLLELFENKIQAPETSDVRNNLNNFFNAVGVNIETVDHLLNREGKLDPSLSAETKVQRLGEKVITSVKILENQDSFEVRAEEAAHIYTALLGYDHPLYKSMEEKITSMSEYKTVKQLYPELKTEKEIKFEAIGHAIRNHALLIANEEPTDFFMKAWFKAFKRAVDSILAKIFKDPFKQTALNILRADISDLNHAKAEEVEANAKRVAQDRLSVQDEVYQAKKAQEKYRKSKEQSFTLKSQEIKKVKETQKQNSIELEKAIDKEQTAQYIAANFEAFYPDAQEYSEEEKLIMAKLLLDGFLDISCKI